MKNVLAVLALLLASSRVALALQPDQIALVVNRNEPKGIELAQNYAKARGIPDDRIIALDIPAAEEMPADQFTRDAAEPVRQFLKHNNLDKRVTCLVTFYGVPIRVAARASTTQETAELAHLTAELTRVRAMVAPAIADLERLTAKLDPSFRPAPGDSIEQLAHRGDLASKSLAIAVQRIDDPEKRQSATAEMIRVTRPFSAPVPNTSPATAPTAATQLTREQARELALQANTPDARRKLRDSSRQTGPFPYAQMLMIQRAFLDAEQSDASFDSELALIWWSNYPRAGWQPNPLNLHVTSQPGVERVLMVARLDGPTPEIVQRMIETSIEVERAGLKGRVVIDSRGVEPRDVGGKINGFGAFDQFLRNVAGIIRQKTTLELVFDEKPEVLPAEHPVDNVAIYFGWYSVERYVPGMKFNPGAVGVHIASYTLAAIHRPREGDWVRGLLTDGCVATFGAVSEPLLHAFARPDEFLPLLLTGKLTLAEVYWRTNPLVSWKMSLIGDPLYTPYKSNPAMRVEDLSPALQRVFSDGKQ